MSTFLPIFASLCVLLGASNDAPLDRAATLLKGIGETGREENLRRWRVLFELSEQSADVRDHLVAVAKGSVPARRYEKYVAAAHVAGFGMPSGLGPNFLKETLLVWYLDFQASLRVPRDKPRRIRLAPSLIGFKVSIEPNADNTLKFQEILWKLILKYEFEFRIEPDGTFFLFPGGHAGIEPGRSSPLGGLASQEDRAHSLKENSFVLIRVQMMFS